MTFGNQVLVKQDKMDKFSTTLYKTPHKIICKDSNNVVVKSPSGATYSWSTTFVNKYYTEDNAPQSTNKTRVQATSTETHNDIISKPLTSMTDSKGRSNCNRG